ncbi:protein STPG4 [Lingula anatina]|uniref:Protein STPG4 n=1 Tax=Lingula anatina TaxID=7574 RepID=A0A1S3H694_LINAN|nr:protein STPG4 [Lingula anatina]|eukprot:XP_013381507.1 protein STPG4 [Lingula anatina]
MGPIQRPYQHSKACYRLTLHRRGVRFDSIMAPPATSTGTKVHILAPQRSKTDISDLGEHKKQDRRASTTPAKNKKRESILARTKGSPTQLRPSLADNYEVPKSGREGWWRSTIKVTPNPGVYDSKDFLHEVQQRPATYRFKGDGRKLDAHPHGKGAMLLPGAYQHDDFLSRFNKSNTTYGFKAEKRDAQDFLNWGKKDKYINVCPTAYQLEKYLSLTVDKQPSKHYFFKSQSNRFPTFYFAPKEGPAPGNYEYSPPAADHAISSSFKSKTPRFKTSHTKVPGPGAYEKTFQSPMSSTITKMGRQHGLFFSSAFEV